VTRWEIEPDQVLEIVTELKREAGVKAAADPIVFSGARCVVCGSATEAEWRQSRGVVLCARHLEAIIRGEL
jgi:hypothetical protein